METGIAATTAQEKGQGPEVVHFTGLDQPLHGKKKETTRGKGPEVVKPTKPAQVDTPPKLFKSLLLLGDRLLLLIKRLPLLQTPIGPKDTLGDIYNKTYTEEAHGNAPQQASWCLKQKDTFLEFGPCHDWFLNSFPPDEINGQRARTHNGLYHAFVVGEANTRAANHQIVPEWRTMVKEWGDWEKYRERVVRQVKEFEKMKAAFAEEKAKFESDKKSEEWGREGLKGKLRAT
ncbi:hypothetical protein Hanom_Chr16g01455151 [Helianthus anomalus]